MRHLRNPHRMLSAWIAGLSILLVVATAAPVTLAEGPAAGFRSLPVLAARTALMQGQAFDTCEIPSFQALQTWMLHSPYRGVNLYIGGSGRYCSNRGLTADLLTRLDALGWRFIPTWVGPQAPCFTGAKPKMSGDPALSYGEGRAEAEAAVEVGRGLGLADSAGAGTIVYYDMEHYNSADAACHAAVRAFVSGWVERLHERGNLAGVYANSAPLISFASLAAVPDAVWPARRIHPAYNPDVTVWDVPDLPRDLYVNHQRIWQYAAGHNETWGGVTINIDCNVVDGIVADISPPDLPRRVFLPLVMGGVPLDAQQ